MKTNVRKDNHRQEIRKRELAKIHVAKKQLGINEEVYRQMLQEIAGVVSARDLDDEGRRAVIEHLVSRGFKLKRGKKPYPGTPNNLFATDRGLQLRKVEAILSENRKSWTYADAIAKRMFGVERVGWCHSEQLQGIITALEKMDTKNGCKKTFKKAQGGTDE